MDELPEQPEWLKNHLSRQSGGGNPKWYPGMPSPNPRGRPKGIVDRRQRIMQALGKDAEAIVAVVNAAARDGDMQACNIILSRVAPALKAQSERVQFPFNAEASLTEQTQAVLQAIADGQVSVDTGKQIIEAISMLSGIRQVDDLQKRIERLEKNI